MIWYTPAVQPFPPLTPDSNQWSTLVEPDNSTKEPQTATERRYAPFSETLRLYAGWLFAWYALVYALGFYSSTRPLPFDIPYIRGMYYSPLVLSFTLGSFLFLLWGSVAAAISARRAAKILLGIAGIAAFVLYRINV